MSNVLRLALILQVEVDCKVLALDKPCVREHAADVLPCVSVENIDTLVHQFHLLVQTERRTDKLAELINVYCHGAKLALLHGEEVRFFKLIQLLSTRFVRSEPELDCKLSLGDIVGNQMEASAPSIEVNLALDWVRACHFVPFGFSGVELAVERFAIVVDLRGHIVIDPGVAVT